MTNKIVLLAEGIFYIGTIDSFIIQIQKYPDLAKELTRYYLPSSKLTIKIIKTFKSKRYLNSI